MKITSVVMDPDNLFDASIIPPIFSFKDPKALSPYNIKSILGLDADGIIPKRYNASGNFSFYNLTLGNREIVIKVGLNPTGTQTYSSLRDNLYRVISSSRFGRIQLQFLNGVEVVAAISGFFSKFETPQFERTQEIQITINCDEPMLRAPTPDSFGVDGLNPALVSVTDLKSTAPHGFMFVLTIHMDMGVLSVSDPDDSSWSFEIVPVGGFISGDIVHFSSEFNNKYLYLIREPDTIQIADAITPGSVWPIMFPGVNNFSWSVSTDVELNDISYYPTYWGV